MRDQLEQELEIGNTVIFIAPGYRRLVTGQIVKFTTQTVLIKYINDWNYSKERQVELTIRQTPDQIIKMT